MIRHTKYWVLALVGCLVAGVVLLVLTSTHQTNETADAAQVTPGEQRTTERAASPHRAVAARWMPGVGEDPSALGGQRVYRFDLATTFVGTDPNQGGLTLAGSGLIALTVADQRGDSTLLAGQVSEARLGASTGEVAPRALTEEFRRGLELPFVLSVRPTGHFDTLSTVEGLEPMSYNLLRTILSGLQFVSPQDGNWKEWDTQETDHNGHYQARYRQLGSEEFERTKLRYTELTSLSGAILSNDGRAPVVNSSTRFQLGAHGLVASADTKESTTVPFGKGALTAESNIGLTLQNLRTAQVPDIDLTAMVTEPLNHSRSREQDLQRREDKLRARVAGADVHQLMDAVETLERSEDNTQLWATERRLAASLELDPSGAAAVVQRLRDNVDPADAQMLLAALSDANSSETQAALAEIVEDPQIEAGVRSSALTHLGLSEAPSADTIETLDRVAETADDQQTRDEALLALGSAAGSGRADEATRDVANGAVSELERRYEQASTPEEKALLLAALGNAASTDSSALIQRALSDPDPMVRKSAVRALRALDDPEVEQTLIRVLFSDGQALVREEAAKVLGRRPYSEVVGQALDKLLQSDPDKHMRITALSIVSGWLEEHPELMAMVEHVAVNDEDEEVRAAAERELAAHERYIEALAASAG